MNRVMARVRAMQLVYEWEMGGEGGEQTRLGLLEVRPDEEEYGFMTRLFEGVVANAAALDARIAQCAHGWSLERLSRVDLAILRLALYELSLGQTPSNVVVSEALEMARQYSTEKSPRFINGVLGAASRGEGA